MGINTIPCGSVGKVSSNSSSVTSLLKLVVPYSVNSKKFLYLEILDIVKYACKYDTSYQYR